MPQKTISLIDAADTNTTVRTLTKLAQGMGEVLGISSEDRGQDENGMLEA